MYINVKSVKALSDFRLIVTFDNDEQKIFDVKPYLEKGIFSELKDKSLFNSVQVSFDTVEWSNGADICPEVLYENGVLMDEKKVTVQV